MFEMNIPMLHLQTFTYEIVDELEKTERGSGGFGSSGINYLADV